MKHPMLLLCFCCAGLLTACASSPPLRPVGPAPGPQTLAPPGEGVLVVYSAWSCFDNYLTADHSGYNIYSNDGKLVKWVPNFIEGDWTVEPPTRVHLPAGSYTIKAEGGIYGWVYVPVVIKCDQTTPVYLDDENHPIASMASMNNVVKLPDGEIVGWAANPGTN